VIGEKRERNQSSREDTEADRANRSMAELEFQKVQQLTYEQQEELLQELLADPLLQDVPNDTTVAEVSKMLGLETGGALTIDIVRMDGLKIPMILSPDATLRDLKNELKAVIAQKVEKRKKKINWKHVWKTSCLTFKGNKLLNDSVLLKDLGVSNQSELYFAKYKPTDKRGRN